MVEKFKFVPLKQISERVREQIVDVALQFGKEVLTQTQELKMQMNECSGKISVLRKQKSGIFGQVRNRLLERRSSYGRRLPVCRTIRSARKRRRRKIRDSF